MMSADIIVGIDPLSLLLTCMLITVELYAYFSGNDILLVVGLASIILLYGVRIWNRRRLSPHFKYSPGKNAPSE